jgi:hypothetical protein
MLTEMQVGLNQSALCLRPVFAKPEMCRQFFVNLPDINFLEKSLQQLSLCFMIHADEHTNERTEGFNRLSICSRTPPKRN